MLSALVCMAALAAPSRHALLISVSAPDDDSPANDCRVIQESLLRAGWKLSEIETRTSATNRDLEAVEAQNYDQLLVFVSGNGTVDARTLTPQFGPGWSWKQAVGGVPGRGKYAFLTDTGYTNLLTGWLAPNVGVIVPDATWRDTTQSRRVATVVHNGLLMRVGIVSYVLSREIPFATDLEDLAYRVNKTLDSGSMAAIWAQLPRVKMLGRGRFPIN